MDMSKLNRILKYIILILLIILLIVSVYFKFDDCDKCKFKINNKTSNANQFMDSYYEKCLSFDDPILNQDLSSPFQTNTS